MDEEARFPGIGASALTEVEIARKTAVTCAVLVGGCGGEPGVAGTHSRRVIRGRRRRFNARSAREDTRCALRELTRESRVPADGNTEHRPTKREKESSQGGKKTRRRAVPIFRDFRSSVRR